MFFNAIAFISVAVLALREAQASPSFSSIIDLTLLESAPSPPHDLDIDQDHPFASYNIQYNTSWFITTRGGTSPPVWVHESRLPASNGNGNEVMARSDARNWILVSATEPSSSGSESGSCPDAEHLFEISCINLRSLTDDDPPEISWNIGEEGPTGHAGAWLFNNINCDGDATYSFRGLDNCINAPKGTKGLLWSSY